MTIVEFVALDTVLSKGIPVGFDHARLIHVFAQVGGDKIAQVEALVMTSLLLRSVAVPSAMVIPRDAPQSARGSANPARIAGMPHGLAVTPGMAGGVSSCMLIH